MNPISEIALLAKLRKPINQLKGLLMMPLNWSRFLQILAVIIQILNIIAPIIPAGDKVYVATLIGVIQVLLHNFAGNTNPDGTPATGAYIPPPR